jgi:enoyl-CoA hydratase/carnithine racemase
MYEDILYSVDDPVATITFNRPDRLNALTGRMLAEMRHAFAAAEDDPAVVGILLTGAGRGFCAGADMASLEATSEGDAGLFRGAGAELAADPGAEEMGPDFKVSYAWLMAVRKPILAAINGPCAGLGFAIAMLCDLRFAAESAVFTTAFANRGLIAEHGTSWILPRLLGPSRALDLLWSGRKFDAAEAERLGVVNRVLPDADLPTAARAYLEDLATRSSPTSLMVIKQQVYRHLLEPVGAALRDTDRLMAESLERPDFKEGVASYLEKRAPRFGRVGKAAVSTSRE